MNKNYNAHEANKKYYLSSENIYKVAHNAEELIRDYGIEITNNEFLRLIKTTREATKRAIEDTKEGGSFPFSSLEAETIVLFLEREYGIPAEATTEFINKKTDPKKRTIHFSIFNPGIKEIEGKEEILKNEEKNLNQRIKRGRKEEENLEKRKGKKQAEKKRLWQEKKERNEENQKIFKKFLKQKQLENKEERYFGNEEYKLTPKQIQQDEKNKKINYKKTLEYLQSNKN